MKSSFLKYLFLFTIFIYIAFMSGCYVNKISEIGMDVQKLKKDVYQIEKDRAVEKQQLDKRIKMLEESIKGNTLRTEELIQRMPVVGGTVEEEQINEGGK